MSFLGKYSDTKHPNGGWVLLLFVVVSFCGALFRIFNFADNDSLYSVGIIFIPIISLLFAFINNIDNTASKNWLYCWFSKLSIIAYCICIFIYGGKFSFSYWWCIPFVCALILFCFTVKITKDILSDNKKHGINKNAYDILFYLLTIFLSITYLFGIAFAMNDKSLREEYSLIGLYINPISISRNSNRNTNTNTNDFLSTQSNVKEYLLGYFKKPQGSIDDNIDNIIEIVNTSTINKETKPGTRERLRWVLEYLVDNHIVSNKNYNLESLVDIVSYSLLMSKNNKVNESEKIIRKLKNIFLNDNEISDSDILAINGIFNLYMLGVGNSFSIIFDGEMLATVNQNKTIEDIIDRIKHYIKYSQLSIMLIGHTNQTKITDLTEYSNNYDLSEARINSVKAVVLERLIKDIGHTPPINWYSIPLASENFYLTHKGTKEQRSVEVIIEAKLDKNSLVDYPLSRNSPTFLEYLYFSIYTITTTGYGDILPVSPTAKFLSSIANLMELYFMVIFFNVFLVEATRRNNIEVNGFKENVNKLKTEIKAITHKKN